ncbi:MAG: hypothetical protein SGJ11_09635 [Phycisphaerae bacterium]|nr:hypothetical protein [Phycisphaerae bacterium]
MRTHSLASLALVTCVVTCLGGALTGCKSDPLATDFDSIKKDLTPELQAQAERPSDVERNMAVTFEQNKRMIWNDLGRAFYTDRPSYLSPYFTAPTGGQPR